MYFSQVHDVYMYIYIHTLICNISLQTKSLKEWWNLITATCQRIGEREYVTLVVYKRIKASYLCWFRKQNKCWIRMGISVQYHYVRVHASHIWLMCHFSDSAKQCGCLLGSALLFFHCCKRYSEHHKVFGTFLHRLWVICFGSRIYFYMNVLHCLKSQVPLSNANLN